MRIEVNTTGNHTYYLNFDLIVEFSFNNKEMDILFYPIRLKQVRVLGKN